MKNSFCVVDIETKSRCDISRGVTNYFDDLAASLICVVFKIDDAPEKKVWLDSGEPLPKELLNFDGKFIAHNWFFEWSAFKKFYPKSNLAKIENWLCTQAMARRFGLAAPRSTLEDVAKILKTPMQKNDDGKRLINTYSIPDKKTSEFTTISELDREAWLTYCADDVKATYEVFKILYPKFSEAEKEVFEVDKIQQARGVPIDFDAARSLVAAEKKLKADAERKAEKIAGRNDAGVLILSSTSEFLAWLEKTHGVKLKNAQAGTLAELTKNTTDKKLLYALDLRTSLMSRAAGKAEKILSNTAADGRYYNPSVYGAASTGRWQSWGANFFNFSRASVESDVYERTLKAQIATPTKSGLASLQRGMICAPINHSLIVSDWRGIEFYLSLFYSGDDSQRARIEAGESAYLIFGEKLFRKKISKKDAKEYALAKAAVLGLGYGAGHVKFASLAKLQSGIELNPIEAKKIVDTWRAANAPIVRAWRSVEKALREAVSRREVSACGFRFLPLGKDTAKIALPNGYELYYRGCGIDDGDLYFSENGEREKLYGGKIWENLMQATAAQLLRRALVECEREKIEVVLHIYDEIVVECATKNAEKIARKIEQIMCDAPAWASGMKLEIEQKISKRWGK